MTALQDPPAPASPEPSAASQGVAPTAKTRKAPRRPRFDLPARGSAGWVVRTSMFWLAAVAVGFAADIVLVSQLQYTVAQYQDYATLRNSLALATTPVSQTDPDGYLTPVGTPEMLLSIPAIQLRNTVVVEGTTSEALQHGPGHERDTRFPGQTGVSIIQGRAAAFGGPFGDIDKLQIGDEITVTTGQGVFVFRVFDVRREGDPITPLKQDESRITLVTAGGAPFAPNGLVRVDATKISGEDVDPSVVYARDLPTAEQPLGTMPGTLPATILCLQALVVVVLLGVWAWLRWGRWRTWLVFGPVLLLTVVLVGGRLTLLLPNLL